MKTIINQLTPLHILFFCVALIPISNLYAWEYLHIFDIALTHRIWIMGWEIIALIILLFITPFNFNDDIRNNPKIAWPLILFSLFGFVSCSFAENPYASLARHSEIILHFLFIYLLSKHTHKRFVQHLLIGGLIVSFLYTVYHFLLLRLAVGDIEYNWVSNITFFVNIRHWGYLQVLVLPLSYYLILHDNQRLKVAGYSLFFIAWVSIIFSGGRGSLLAGIITCFFIAPIILKLSSSKLLITIGLFLLSIFTATKIEGNHGSLSISRLFFLEQVDYDSSFNVNRTSSNRIKIYQDATSELIEESPIFGLGPDNYRYSLKQQQHSVPTHPHSLPIQFIYEYGALGTLLILVFLFNRVKELSIKSFSSLRKVVLLSLICCLTASLVDGNFYHSFSIFNICLLVAILFQNKNLSSKRVNRKSNILLPATPVLTILALHFFTFFQYTQPLSNQQQIDNLKYFPSITYIQYWIVNHESKSLLRMAFSHGVQWSDFQCGNYKLMGYYFGPLPEDLAPKYCIKNKQ